MSDDEVKGWLSEDERRAWVTAESSARREDYYDRPDEGEACLAALRALAEARKALAAAEPYACVNGVCDDWGCPVCGCESERRRHEPTCIFTTMPRPR